MKSRRPRILHLCALVGSLLAMSVLGCRSEQAAAGPASDSAGAAAGATRPKPVEVEYLRFQFDAEHYSIDYPKDWSAVRIPPPSIHVGLQAEFTAPAAMASLNISHKPLKGASLDEHMRDIEASIESTGGKILERRDLTIEARPSKWLVIDQAPDPNSSSGKAWRMLGYYVLRGQTVWRLWCRSEPALFEKYRPICHHMAESLHFL